MTWENLSLMREMQFLASETHYGLQGCRTQGGRWENVEKTGWGQNTSPAFPQLHMHGKDSAAHLLVETRE